MIAKINKEYYDFIFPFVVMNKDLEKFYIIKKLLSGNSEFSVDIRGEPHGRKIIIMNDINNISDLEDVYYKDIIDLSFGHGCHFVCLLEDKKIYVPIFFKFIKEHIFTIGY